MTDRLTTNTRHRNDRLTVLLAASNKRRHSCPGHWCFENSSLISWALSSHSFLCLVSRSVMPAELSCVICSGIVLLPQVYVSVYACVCERCGLCENLIIPHGSRLCWNIDDLLHDISDMLWTVFRCCEWPKLALSVGSSDCHEWC